MVRGAAAGRAGPEVAAHAAECRSGGRLHALAKQMRTPPQGPGRAEGHPAAGRMALKPARAARHGSSAPFRATPNGPRVQGRQARTARCTRPRASHAAALPSSGAGRRGARPARLPL